MSRTSSASVMWRTAICFDDISIAERMPESGPIERVRPVLIPNTVVKPLSARMQTGTARECVGEWEVAQLILEEPQRKSGYLRCVSYSLLCAFPGEDD